MSVSLPPVLVVDDEKNMRLSLQTMLGDEGYATRSVESAEAALELLQKDEFFLVISDARLGGMSGYDFLAKARTQWPELPVLMITAYATPKLAVEAIKAGAIDYLSKPFAPEELLHAVGRCAERHRLLVENAALRARASETYTLDQIIGESPKILELRSLIRTVALADATVLILGESGTGKELLARMIHRASEQRHGPFIPVNLTAIPADLVESVLSDKCPVRSSYARDCLRCDIESIRTDFRSLAPSAGVYGGGGGPPRGCAYATTDARPVAIARLVAVAPS